MKWIPDCCVTSRKVTGDVATGPPLLLATLAAPASAIAVKKPVNRFIAAP
jgi:hypothetical protein